MIAPEKGPDCVHWAALAYPSMSEAQIAGDSSANAQNDVSPWLSLHVDFIDLIEIILCNLDHSDMVVGLRTDSRSKSCRSTHRPGSRGRDGGSELEL